MAKKYTSTIQARAWKEHACLDCGGTYAYVLARKVTGEAPTAEAAEAKAQANVARTLATDVDVHPCPTCGLVQPDMVGQRRAVWHQRLFWVGLAVLALVVILRLTYGARTDTLALAGAAAAAALVAAHLWVDLTNPNRDVAANRRTATERAAAGVLRHAPGRPPGPRPVLAGAAGGGGSRPAVHTAALSLLVVAAVLVPGPELARAARGWPTNPDTYPPVAGPGDAARVYMEQQIQSVKGYWRGRPHVTVVAADGRSLDASARTNENNWGSSISAKSSEKNNRSNPWVEVGLPPAADLAGQTVRCEIDLDVTYPHMAGSDSFEEERRNLHREVNLRLAPPGAGADYNAYWWVGTAGGLGLVVACAQVLRASGRALQRRANPTKLYPV